MRKLALALLITAAGAAAPVFAASEGGSGAIWRTWHANANVGDRASLQRGASNFVNYCSGCHSLRFMRWSRMAADLRIPEDVLKANLLPSGVRVTDYMLTALPEADANAWFGKAPPDLSLIARSRGSDYVYQFLKTFYADPAAATGVNNLALPGTAMPHVLSDLQGVPVLVQKDGHFEKFDEGVPGHLSAADYNRFVRDTVNFLTYVSEPAKLVRTTLGIWVILFLLLFTTLAWMLKKEYWKDVH